LGITSATTTNIVILNETAVQDKIMVATAGVLHFVAGLLETGWAVGFKYTERWTKILPSAVTLLFMAGSFYLLSKSLEELPTGTAYAVWTGIGAVGTVIIGMLVLGESRDVLRVLCILLIVDGIIGLMVMSPESSGYKHNPKTKRGSVT
jgi:quaternary ammonium compound-resistance protein SugE